MSENESFNWKVPAARGGKGRGGGGGGGGARGGSKDSKMETVGTVKTASVPQRSQSPGPQKQQQQQTGNQQRQQQQQHHHHRHHHTADNPVSLWDIAAQESKNKEPLINKESTVIVVGSKGSGKTTLINAFLDKRESVRETVALECSFGRKMQLGKVTRDIAQFWELGGGTAYLPLLEVAITPARLQNLILIIVVDFSSPKQLWNVISLLYNHVAQLINKIRPKIDDSASQRVRQLFQDSSLDVATKCPIVIPTLIVVNKYDMFHDMSHEERRSMVSCLRVLSVTFGAALLFTDQKSKTLISRFKAFVNHLCFDHPPPNGVVFDNKNPIVIPWGKDNFEQIGTPKSSVKPTADRSSFIEIWRQQLQDVFKTTATHPLQQQQHLTSTESISGSAAATTAAAPPDPTSAFAEAAVDAARHAKKYEAERKRREKEKERKDREEKEKREAESRSQKLFEEAPRTAKHSSGSDKSSSDGVSHGSTLSRGAMQTIEEDESDNERR